MQENDEFIYTAVIPGASVRQGEIRYYFEAIDSIGQLIHVPHKSQGGTFRLLVTSDREPPQFIHGPVREWNPREPLEIKAKVTDKSGIDRVLLYYRPTRQAMQYLVETMRPDEEGFFSATIPGEIFTTEFDMIYFFEAVDLCGNGIFYPNQDKKDPHIVIKIRR